MITTADVPLSFDAAAPRYDLLVSLNPGYHRHLRAAAKALVEVLGPTRRQVRLADLGCGSGASTRALLSVTEAAGLQPDIIGVDASAGMLAQARQKDWPAGVVFRQGYIQQLSAARADWSLAEPVAGVLAAYLFRNVAERDEVLRDVFDLIEDGGALVVQEYSVAGRPLAEAIWTLVCWLVVIPLSVVTGGKPSLYRYLWRSVREFDAVPTFLERLHRAGFTDVEVRTVRGWQRGILHTFRARKPRG